MSDSREFTLEEANALVPELHELVSRQLVKQEALEGKLRQLHGLLGHLPRDLAVLGSEPAATAALKNEVSQLLEEVDAGWARVQAMGGHVKDPRVGLVDFYGRVGGRLVFFCWRFGEEFIGHYHEVDEGFSGRRSLPQQPRHRLFN